MGARQGRQCRGPRRRGPCRRAARRGRRRRCVPSPITHLICRLVFYFFLLQSRVKAGRLFRLDYMFLRERRAMLETFSPPAPGQFDCLAKINPLFFLCFSLLVQDC
jgi:hypothetical protein